MKVHRCHFLTSCDKADSSTSEVYILPLRVKSWSTVPGPAPTHIGIWDRTVDPCCLDLSVEAEECDPFVAWTTPPVTFFKNGNLFLGPVSVLLDDNRQLHTCNALLCVVCAVKETNLPFMVCFSALPPDEVLIYLMWARWFDGVPSQRKFQTRAFIQLTEICTALERLHSPLHFFWVAFTHLCPMTQRQQYNKIKRSLCIKPTAETDCL